MTADIFFSGKHIRVESCEHGVKKLFLARSAVKNAFDQEMIQEITFVLAELKKQDPGDMRLLVLLGEGSVFCAGADLNDMKAQALLPQEKNIEHAKNLATLFFSLADFPSPVISAVHGAAIAGGLGLVACSDHVLAQEKTVFSTSEVLLGLVPGVISPYVIRKIGTSQASFLMLTGSRIDAQQALNMHLIHHVCSAEDFQSQLSKTIELFLKAGPLSARKTKELIKNASPLPTEQQIDFTLKQIAFARCSPEGQAGLTAFFEKKLPYWSSKDGRSTQ